MLYLMVFTILEGFLTGFLGPILMHSSAESQDSPPTWVAPSHSLQSLDACPEPSSPGRWPGTQTSIKMKYIYTSGRLDYAVQIWTRKSSVSSALAGRFLTTVPSGKPRDVNSNSTYFFLISLAKEFINFIHLKLQVFGFTGFPYCVCLFSSS